MTAQVARSPRARSWLRAGLTVLALITLVTGAWQYFAPRSFYTDVPTVSADPPFNQHLMTDVGGLGLTLAVVLVAAAATMDRLLIRVALAAYLVYSVSHLLFHVTHLMGLSPGGTALLVTALTLLPALAIALVILSIRAAPAR